MNEVIVAQEETNETQQGQQETALAVPSEQGISNASVANKNMWNDAESMKLTISAAKMLASTAAMPDSYKGKVGDCMILIDLAGRMGLSPIAVAQFTQVVKGNLTWKGQACKALIDGSGRFRNSRYEMFGEEGKDSWGCRLVAERKADGVTVIGPEVSIKMANDMGWTARNGSPWLTMPELMLRYRAATFFARTECPETLMGFYTADEMADIKGE